MRKCFIFLTVVAMLFGTLLVSCNQDAKIEDSLNTVRISFPESRGVTSSVVSTIKDVDELFWYYVATKTDAGLYAHGQTTWKSIDEFEEGEDLGAFSQGSWSFSFYGFANATSVAPANKSSAAIYYAENIAVTIDDADVYVNIALTAGSIDDGKITFKDLSFDLKKIPAADLNGAPKGDFKLVVTEGETTIATTDVVDDYTYSSSTKTISFSFDELTSKTIEEIASGSHTYTFTVYFKPATGAPSDFYDVAHQNLTVTVNKGLEFTFTGDVFKADPLNDVYIGEITGEASAVATNTISAAAVPTDGSLTIESNVSPAGTESADAEISITTVEFAAGSIPTLDAGEYTLFTGVTGIEKVSSDTASFKVISETNPVAAIDLTLKNGDAVVSLTGNGDVTVTTYIAKNLQDVVVCYNGVALDVEKYQYDRDTGKLVFVTDHFSLYCVGSTSEAYIVETGMAYDTLGDALAAAASGNTIKLISDVTLGSTHTPKTYASNLTFDGQKHIVTLDGVSDSWLVEEAFGNSVIKDVTIKKAGNSSLPSIVYMGYGNVTFSNVNLGDEGCIDTVIEHQGNNEGGFISFPWGSSLTFENCASYYSHASSGADTGIGVFVGGYFWYPITLTMDGCKNYGNVSSAYAGYLVGNDQRMDNLTATITNCENTGKFVGYKDAGFAVRGNSDGGKALNETYSSSVVGLENIINSTGTPVSYAAQYVSYVHYEKSDYTSGTLQLTVRVDLASAESDIVSYKVIDFGKYLLLDEKSDEDVSSLNLTDVTGHYNYKIDDVLKLIVINPASSVYTVDADNLTPDKYLVSYDEEGKIVSVVKK